MSKIPPNERPSARDLADGDAKPMTIAGKPAHQCPYCGAGMFAIRTDTHTTVIIRRVNCRTCGKRFVAKQPPATLIREVGADDEDSRTGKETLQIRREIA
jgi:DNA-directed RNA polymerase subunit RPC12/RpoP